jgi:drug/metabolite transporter (DMT)-like permease
MSLNFPRILEGQRVWVAAGYVTVVLIWGTTWFGVHTQVNGTAPHVAVALRLGAASLIFFAIARAMRLSLRLERRHFAAVAAQGFCFFGVNYVCVYTASQYLTSGVLAVLFSVTVPFNIVADRVLNGTRPRPLVVVAALIGVCGIALVFAGELEHALAAEHAVRGAVLAVVAAAIVAVGNVLATRLAATSLGAVRINAFGLAVGTAAILLWGAASGAPWSLHVTAEWLAGYVYLLVVGSVAAFWIYLKLLPIVGAVAGAYVVVLSPVVAVAISAAFEDLPFGWEIVAGVVLLLAGHSLLVAQRARS